MRYLFLISIGPVQGFIASARKTEDLWSGSYLLSFLAETAIDEARKNSQVDLIYPFVDVDQLNSIKTGARMEVASLPNRVLLNIDGMNDEEMDRFGKRIEDSIRMKWLEMGKEALEKVFPLNRNEYMERMAERQLNSLLEIYWAYLPRSENYNDDRKKLEKIVAALKNEKEFPLGEQEGIVCTVCGMREALHEEEIGEEDTVYAIRKKVEHTWALRNPSFRQAAQKTDISQESSTKEDRPGRILDNERLCAVCLVKRYGRTYFGNQRHKGRREFPPFPSVVDFTFHELDEPFRYYAILMMDGDDMGEWISRNRFTENDQTVNGEVEIKTGTGVDIHYHREVSKRLTRYSLQTIPRIIEEIRNNHKGHPSVKLIYGGGDDLLAITSLHQLYPLIGKLREAFQNPDIGLGEKATSSMGIVIAHEMTPLQHVIRWARQMEKKAKAYLREDGTKKDAFAIGLYMKSGERREIVLPWSTDPKQRFERNSRHSMPKKLNDLKDVMVEKLSSTFLFHFAEAFMPMIASEHEDEQRKTRRNKIEFLSEDAIRTEMFRLVHRSRQENGPELTIDEQKKVVDDLWSLYALTPSFLEFIHVLEMNRFLAALERKRLGKGGEKE